MTKKDRIEDRVLLVSNGSTMADLRAPAEKGRAVFHSCPAGYLVGAIVNRNDWIDQELFGVYGEAVFVNPAKKDVQFVDEENGLPCTVLKTGDVKCVGHVYGRKIIWV